MNTAKSDMSHESSDSDKNISKNIDSQRVSVLSEALPYIQRFSGKRIVIKYGGAAMTHESLQHATLRDIALLSTVGVQPVVIHGGGPEINLWLKKLGIDSSFKNGLRITDDKTMDIVEMVLIGRVNKKIVSGINKLGANSVGLCGLDGKLIEASPLDSEAYGRVGEISKINIDVLEPILSKGYVPVISSVAATESGQSLNINADTIAGEIAVALGAEKLILLTDTPGILKNQDHPSSLINKINKKELQKLVDNGVIDGGMLPKSQCCMHALSNGVLASHIIDGRVPHALLLEVLTDTGIGTMVVAE